jgi:hypothetical protein
VATDQARLVITPDDQDVLHGYATVLSHLGDTLRWHDNLNSALECYQKELALGQELQQRSPETRYSRGVAVAFSHIGQNVRQHGRLRPIA